ncbi:AAA-ATPase-like protein (fragment) [Desulfamplus magnetovallimortis]|uniref:AAA-ATPase-like protein n=2 Tax=Desulfamplus magnetovallimortis TaxID=1246637 RepID=A0A1W1HCQ3_9BACT
MMGIHNDKERYNALVHDEGILRTLFKAVKSSTSGSGFDRVFITGVSPVVLSDITSGYNIAKDIYFKKQLNDICGFTEKEVISALVDIVESCGIESGKSNGAVENALDIMKTYYNGYCFVPRLNQYIYNPTLCLYFFDQFQEMCDYPRKMLDSNLATDESKLEYVAQIPMGREIIVSMMERDNHLEVGDLSDRFGIREMLDESFKNNMFIVSFLYYFGVLTLAGETEDLNLKLKVPNLVMQSLYVERVQRMLLPEPAIRDEGRLAAAKVYQKGDMEPLCNFVENSYFSVFKNRDYRWANELVLKTAFLTLLYNDIIFIMDSETELKRRYADLTMIIRPDKRYGKIFDVLIEFKFVTLKDACMTGEEAKRLSKEALYGLPQIKKAFEEGEKQVIQYGKHLDEKYGNLRLQKFVVVALGFERVCFRKLT